MSEPAKPIGGLFPELYKDAQKENGVPGTLIPAATTRTDSAGAGFAANRLGASFNLQKPVAHNIVEVDDDGSQKITPLNDAAIEILRTRNHVSNGQKGNPISYFEAARLAAGGPAVVKQALSPAQSALQPASPVVGEGLPRILVRFEGSFGKVSGIFNGVFRDATNAHLLVLTQHDSDGCFFEAPQVETPIIVRFDETQYSCVPATFFTLPDGLTRYTLLAIQE